MTAPPLPQRRWGLVSVIASGIAAALVLYFFSPTEYGFYPRCYLYQSTGLQCPGCGSLRALHQLTHGHLAAAFRFNPLLIILLPVALWYGINEAARRISGRRLLPWPFRAKHGWILLGIALIFGVLRNLPMFK